MASSILRVQVIQPTKGSEKPVVLVADSRFVDLREWQNTETVNSKKLKCVGRVPTNKVTSQHLQVETHLPSKLELDISS